MTSDRIFGDFGQNLKEAVFMILVANNYWFENIAKILLLLSLCLISH